MLGLLLSLNLSFFLSGGGVSAGIAGGDGGGNSASNQLLNLGLLSNTVAQVVKLGAANFAGADNLNLDNAG